MITQEITYEVKGQKVSGTMTLPEGINRPPVVLIAHGFGADRNEVKSEYVPEGILGLAAKKFAENGIASLRIDMRGCGKSEGNFSDLTLEGVIEDEIAGIEYLKKCAEIDTDRISIMGFSLGGAAATAVAGRLNKEIRSAVFWNPGINPPAVFTTVFGQEIFNRALASPETVHTISMGDFAIQLKGEYFMNLFKVVPTAELARYEGPVFLVTSTNDEFVYPQPANGSTLLYYHNGEHEMWTCPADHSLNCSESSNTVNNAIENTIAFFNKH